MPRGAYHICHDALKPRRTKCCPSGGALDSQRLACARGFALFPLSVWAPPMAGVPGKRV